MVLKKNKFIFILGGVRSGKSRFALELARQWQYEDVLFVATAEAKDEEMRERIEKHRKERPDYWKTLESPRNVGKAINEYPTPVNGVIIDCVTVLLGNIMSEMDESEMDEPYSIDLLESIVFDEFNQICEAYQKSTADFIVVSNEVGLGVVPAFASGRIYRDVLGTINQKFAAVADEVFFLISGIPLKVK